MHEAQTLLQNVTYTNDPYFCLEGADIAVIITEWDQFRALDMERVKSTLSQPILVDLRNVYSADYMTKLGFEYHSVGRP